MARLTGPQVHELLDAILDAFDDRQQLEQLLLRLYTPLEAICAPGQTLPACVLEIIRWAEEGNRTADLLYALFAARPDALDLQSTAFGLLAQVAAPSSAPTSFHVAPLTQPQTIRLRNAIAYAFSPDDLRAVVLGAAGADIHSFVNISGPRLQVAQDLVFTANRQGWTGQLLRGVAEARPDVSDLQELIHEVMPEGIAAPELAGPQAPITSFPAPLPTVFISYVARDASWKERFRIHIEVLQHLGVLDIWDQDLIGAGQDAQATINSVIERALVAVLLMSPDFLANKFILLEQVPRLIERRDRAGLHLFPVIVRHCLWRHVPWLAGVAARPPDGRPIAEGTDPQIDEMLSAIAEEIAGLV